MRKINKTDYLVTIVSGGITDYKNGTCTKQQAVVTGFNAACRAEAIIMEKKYNRETNKVSKNSVYASSLNEDHVMRTVRHTDGNTSVMKTIYNDPALQGIHTSDTAIIEGAVVLELRIPSKGRKG